MIWAYRTEDYHKPVCLGSGNSQERFSSEHERSDIQGSVLLVRDPVLIHFYYGLDGVNEKVFVDLRHAHPLVGVAWFSPWRSYQV